MRALKEYEKILNIEHSSTLNTINNLDNLYADQNKLTKIKEMYLRALKEYEKALNTEHISTLGIVNNSSNLYTDQNKLAEIKKMYLRVLKEYEKALNIEHISILNTVNRSENSRSSKNWPLKNLNLPQNNAPPQNFRLLQKLSFKETTAFYLNRFSRGL
jgi:tetratricopeptide (TPR) repeat protein